MMFKLLQCFTILLVLVSISEAARILAVFPIPSVSHQVVFRPLTQELAKRGHEVVVLTTDPVFQEGKAPANLTEIDVHDLSYEVWTKTFLSGDVTKGDKDDLPGQLSVSFTTITEVFETQLKTAEVRSIINDKSKQFDLLIVEACALVTLGLSHIYKAPVIQISSFGAFMHNLETIGMPMHPIIHPTSVRQRVHNLSNWEKLMEYYQQYKIEKILSDVEEKANKMLQRVLGPDTPALRELRNNVDMLFLNVHPLWELNRPVPPSVIYMGGLHQKPVKELPEDLKTYLDSSKNGVIYISFGTNVEPSLLPPEKIQMILNVFSKSPYNILWKWNKDELPGRTENIKISKWLPQSDLLRHPNVKIIITQGGLQSTDEAITAGVPLIGIPMLGDQWFNADMYPHHKIGLRIDMETLTEEQLEYSIQTIIKNESFYRKNVAHLRSVMHDQKETPLERTVWWTEYVIRHKGAKHLRSPTANISWAQYYDVELVAYVLLALLSMIVMISYVSLSLWSYVTQKFTSIKIKKQ